MEVTHESLANFQRAVQFEAFLGILDTTSGNIHLALAEPRGIAPQFDASRKSYINGKPIALPLGNGGHSGLAQAAGLSGYSISPLVIGFSIIKLGVNQYEIGTVCSALNATFDDNYPRLENPPRSKLVPESLNPESKQRSVPESYLTDIMACLNAQIGTIK